MVLQVGPGAEACVSAPGSAGPRIAEGGRADQRLSQNREKRVEPAFPGTRLERVESG